MDSSYKLLLLLLRIQAASDCNSSPLHFTDRLVSGKLYCCCLEDQSSLRQFLCSLVSCNDSSHSLGCETMDIFTAMICACFFFITITTCIDYFKKYEGIIVFFGRRNEVEGDVRGVVYEDELWKTCLRQVRPIYLMAYRIFAFFMLVHIFLLHFFIHGRITFYFYTEWTYALTTIYFLVGSLISIYAYFRLRRGELNEEQASPRRVASFCGYIFQIMYQILAGAVVFSTCLYWFVILPIRITTLHDKSDFVSKTFHSVNILFFLCEAAFNNMPFPWFRMPYFCLSTCIYVVFQWILHVRHASGWLYFFLNLSNPYSPFWYIILALVHFPSYAAIYLFIKLKEFLLKNFLQDG